MLYALFERHGWVDEYFTDEAGGSIGFAVFREGLGRVAFQHLRRFVGGEIRGAGDFAFDAVSHLCFRGFLCFVPVGKIGFQQVEVEFFIFMLAVIGVCAGLPQIGDFRERQAVPHTHVFGFPVFLRLPRLLPLGFICCLRFVVGSFQVGVGLAVPLLHVLDGFCLFEFFAVCGAMQTGSVQPVLNFRRFAALLRFV